MDIILDCVFSFLNLQTKKKITDFFRYQIRKTKSCFVCFCIQKASAVLPFRVGTIWVALKTNLLKLRRRQSGVEDYRRDNYGRLLVVSEPLFYE